MRCTTASLLSAILLWPAPLLADLSADQTPFSSYRGLWVSRFEYSTENSIRSIMANAASLGITDVMFQVRGRADAYYDSAYERRVVTSFDPLATAVAEAHTRGIRLHAWVNMMPLWSGTNLPTGDSYLINQRPEFWIRDASGSPQPLNSSYVIVNPARQDVQTHISNVVRDIAAKYPIDGIHMDYIRLTDNNTGGGNPVEFPSDPFTVALFQQQYPGQTPTTHIANYKAFLASRITDLVSTVRDTVKSTRPNAQITAAVWRDASIGLAAYQQDWAAWVDQGLLDAAIPMIYFKNSPTYSANVTGAVNHHGNAGILAGVGVYLQDDPATAYANLMSQYTTARDQGANGIQIFSYTSLFAGDAVAAERLRATRDFFAANSMALPPVAVTDFELDEGYFGTSLTASGSNRNIASASADRTTAESRSGIASQRLTINKTPAAPDFLARHVAGIGVPGDFNSNLQFPSIGSVGFWLKTATPDLQVSIALDDTVTGDRAYFKNVIADGQWHKYEWFLNDVTHWDTWPGVGGDGKIASIFSIDSIQLTGTQDATLFLDDVFYNPSAIAPNQWTRDADALWSHAGNWTGPVPNGVGAAANLLRRATTPRTVVVKSPITLGHLIFDNSSSYTIAGTSRITMDVENGAASITILNRGAHAIESPILLRDPLLISVDTASKLTLSGTLDNSSGMTIATPPDSDGELVISGPQLHGPGASLTITAGHLRLTSDAGSAAARNLSLTVGPAASAEFEATQHLDHLDVSGRALLTPGLSMSGDKVIRASSLALSPSARLDIADNALILQSAGSDSLASLESLIASARGAGDWDGPGLTSSAAADDSARLTGLAILLNRNDAGSPIYTEFSSEAVDADSILVTYTWNGDMDLNRILDIDDYFLIDTGFLAYQAGLVSNAVYAQGDLDFNDIVDIDDYFLIDTAFLGQSMPLPLQSSRSAVAIPEPRWAALLALLPALASRARRNGGSFPPAVADRIANGQRQAT